MALFFPGQKPVLSNVDKVSCSRKQHLQLVGIEPGTFRSRVRRFTTAPQRSTEGIVLYTLKAPFYILYRHHFIYSEGTTSHILTIIHILKAPFYILHYSVCIFWSFVINESITRVLKIYILVTDETYLLEISLALRLFSDLWVCSLLSKFISFRLYFHCSWY